MSKENKGAREFWILKEDVKNEDVKNEDVPVEKPDYDELFFHCIEYPAYLALEQHYTAEMHWEGFF